MVERIVAVGLLTARDLEVLGSGFRRMFPVERDTSFDDLLTAIDEAVVRKGGDGAAPASPTSGTRA